MSDRETKSERDPLAALARECEIEFTRAGGPGGQHRNKTETAVRLTHRPTGTVVVASERRSQARNRKLALQRLAARLAEIQRREEMKARRQRRRPTAPSAAADRRRLEGKTKHGQKKASRLRVRQPADDE